MIWPALAGPTTTTIQDVLYKADGSRFNGIAIISWSGFEASDGSNISPQSTTIKIVNGNLRVQLVPTTTAATASYYTVRYHSDGKVQFTETWSVPASTTTLRVKDVRISSSTVGAELDATAGSILETDVVGLVADLSARPEKGAAYTPGSVAVINSQGALDGITGDASDCVRADGSSGPCVAALPSFIDGETPAGAIDGSNAIFTLAQLPDPSTSLALYRNGLLLKAGLDYTLTGQTVVFTAALPQTGDTLLASYRAAASASPSAAAAAGTLSAAPVRAARMYPAAEVLCSGTGAAANGAEWSQVGVCTIEAGALTPGGRVQVLVDYAHTGGTSPFSVEIRWGGTSVLRRVAPAGETLVSGRVDAALHPGGAQVSGQSWGRVLAPETTVTDAGDALDQALTLTFLARVEQSGDAVALRNFTVVRLP